MKLIYSLLLLALIATVIAEKPHAHSFGEKVKEKTQHVMENVKATANDASDTLNQAKYKVKNAAHTVDSNLILLIHFSHYTDLKEGIKEGFESAKEALNINKIVEETKEAAKAKLADISPITQNMTTIATEAKNVIKAGVITIRESELLTSKR